MSDYKKRNADDMKNFRQSKWPDVVKAGKIKTVTGLMGTFSFRTDTNCPVSRSLYVNREFGLRYLLASMEFSRLYSQRKKNTGTMLDVGGNIGTACIQAIVAGEVEKAIAIEADPACFHFLRLNVQQNNLENKIITINAAASSHKTTVKLGRNPINLANSKIMLRSEADLEANANFGRELVEIETDTLDNIVKTVPEDFLDDIAVAVIDVEGHEPHLFGGGRSFFSKDIPVISECAPTAMLQGGVHPEEYAKICNELWSFFWTWTDTGFICHPVEKLLKYINEVIGYERGYTDIILTKRKIA